MCENAGSGAYAVVKRIELDGKQYAAKQTDPELLHHAKGHPLWLGLQKRSLRGGTLLLSLSPGSCRWNLCPVEVGERAVPTLPQAYTELRSSMNSAICQPTIH